MDATYELFSLHEQAARPILPKVAAGFPFTYFELEECNA